MKNRDFFYLQYNKINWANQEKTHINEQINQYVIDQIILKHPGTEIAVFDIGFGVGFFLNMLRQQLNERFERITLSGCEPAKLNYEHFANNKPDSAANVSWHLFEETFETVEPGQQFDFITAIYVFPHFLAANLPDVAKKIASLLKESGRFVLVVANEKYLKEKLASQKDLFIEKSKVTLNGESYEEVLHYSDIPSIGKIIDINREKRFYIDLFKSDLFTLIGDNEVNDNGFLCNVFVFEKK